MLSNSRLAFFCGILLIHCTNAICQNGINELVEAYNLLHTDTSNIAYKRNFFKAFPSTFEQLKLYFMERNAITESSWKGGMEDIRNRLYCGVPQGEYTYIYDYFLTSSYIDVDCFNRKTIGICLNGEWSSDAIGWFQGCIIELVRDGYIIKCNSYADNQIDTSHINVSGILDCLNTFSATDIRSFWHFYLDDVYCVDWGVYKNTRARLKHYPKLQRLFKKEYKSMLTCPHKKEGRQWDRWWQEHISGGR